MDMMKFSCGKRAIFREIKEIKRLRGGVHQYAAQVSALIDAEIAEKGRFQMKTSDRLPRDSHSKTVPANVLPDIVPETAHGKSRSDNHRRTH